MTDRQVEKALQEQAVFFERKVQSGQVLEGNTTFSEFAEKWLRDYGERQLAPKTLARYKAMFSRIDPAIGHIRIDRLQPQHLMELYGALGSDKNRRGGSVVATDSLMDALERSGLTRKTVSERSGASINAVYNVFSQNRYLKRL
jgi:hypothetical protein